MSKIDPNFGYVRDPAQWVSGADHIVAKYAIVQVGDKIHKELIEAHAVVDGKRIPLTPNSEKAPHDKEIK